jgi:lipopolysaccharide export system protein LptA
MNSRIPNNEFRISKLILLLILSVWVGISFWGDMIVLAQEPNAPPEEADTTAIVDTTETDTLAEVVRYSADRIEYFVNKDEVLLIGNAEAEFQTTRVTADTLIYNTVTRDVIAIGSPILYEGDNVIEGDRMEYNLDTKQGIAYSGKTKMEQGWFEGDRTYLAEEGVLYVRSGTYTTCDQPDPHSWFAANRLKVMEDNMVIAEPLILYVRGVPTFALPFWFFPIKKGRHSGILTPKFGFQSSDGAFVRDLSYYQIINDYSDATFTLDLLEERGIQYTVEGVYVVNPFFSGKIKTSYIDDILFRQKRWRFNADHTQDLGQNIRIVGSADFLSDENYDVELDEERIVQLNRRLFSYLSVTKRWSIASLEGRLRQEEDLDKQTRSLTLPFINFNLNQFHPFTSPLVVGYRSSLTNSHFVDNKADTISVAQTVNNSIPLSAPFALIGHVNLVPGLSVSTISKNDSMWNHSGTFTNSVGLNTTLYGYSKFGLSSIQRFRHVFKPSLSYNRNQGFTYVSGDFDRDDARESIGIRVANEFQAQKKKEKGIQTINLATFNLSTSYNLETEKLGNISSVLQIDPTQDLEFIFNGLHSRDTLIKDFQLTTRLRLHGEIPLSEDEEMGKGPWNLTLRSNYNFERGEKDDVQLWGNLDFWLTKNWRIGYSSRVDFESKRFVDHNFKLYRDLHEWEASFTFDKIGDNQRLDFKLAMKAIPEIRLGKGIFDLFVP